MPSSFALRDAADRGNREAVVAELAKGAPAKPGAKGREVERSGALWGVGLDKKQHFSKQHHDSKLTNAFWSRRGRRQRCPCRDGPHGTTGARATASGHSAKAALRRGVLVLDGRARGGKRFSVLALAPAAGTAQSS